MTRFPLLLARLLGIPHLPAIQQHQQLLRSWRSILHTCLALEQIMPAAPPEVALGIVEARGEITRLKAQLRHWGADVVDLADELPIAEAAEVAHQVNLLTIYRRNLEHYLQQQSHYADHDVPVHIRNSIVDIRHQIAQIKRRLRDWQAPVSDLPHDSP